MIITTGLPALLLATSANQLVHALFDDTFAGIHHLEFFDWALLAPYFLLLVILSVYGCHRYEMIRRYMKYRKELLTAPPVKFETLPRVTIQLPIYNERYVVERLIEETTRMEYPKHLLQIQVLDDSTDDTAPFAEALVERYHNMGYPIE
jgi:cellulose synthase/poly-beta-1,6-N-acetylglucosamine synthase-like glycosyltransferase